MDLLAHFHALDAFLEGTQPLWSPVPYRHATPAWLQNRADIAHSLLALDDNSLARLQEDPAVLEALVASWVPGLGEALALSRFPEWPRLRQPTQPERLDRFVPGRKWQQVEALVASLPEVSLPRVEWCAGKGHLGRLMSAQWPQHPVTSLERDAQLVAAGQAASRAFGLAQHFVQADVLALPDSRLLSGRHVVALHACGDLHQHLVLQAHALDIAALDLVPCCYHLTNRPRYQSLLGRLYLDRDGLRLPLTETVTARGYDRRQRLQEAVWRLGFDALLQVVTGCTIYQPQPPIPKAWLRGSFEDFCRAMAERAGIKLPSSANLADAEARGQARHARTERLSLLRLAFRAPLEAWLVLDKALRLEAQGYEVAVGRFCARALTPRNLLVHARR
ncbi:methyltransferase [Gulbenkiania mobilis]|uniref:Methyltransferase family protein n=1 Tax=Gulbenkiania mobilis TaxID=397457 RepID=A0ABY2CVE0_GULMO|nr:methyltransferase family protein [Gulbenkiania mobilis]